MSTHDAFVARTKAQIHEWSAEMMLLRARAEKASASARLEIERRLEDARRREEVIARKLVDFETASGTAWGEMKGGLEEAWTDMRDAMVRARKAFPLSTQRH